MMITRIWREQPGDWFFICTKSRKGGWHDEPFAADMLHTVCDYVESNRGKNIYACPHGFTRPRRQKEYAALPKLLWADLDDVDPHEMELQPTVALASSPGRYVGLWQTDRPITEELNKRLSYHLGADRGGWDLTQVLRLVPRTTNFKYAHEPKVKLLWSDGPTYRVRDLEGELPMRAATGNARPKRWTPPPDVTREEGLKIARKHSLGMMFLGPCGNRSDVVFKIVRKLAENGATPEDAFAVVMASRAADRFDGDRKRAWRDVMRCWNKAA